MKTRKFSFAGIINGVKRNLTVSAPVENGGVYTNKYCPQNLLTGSISLVTAVNGEILGEFVTDCQKQVMAMEGAGKQKTLLDVHIAGLMAVVMDHLNRKKGISFGDLLIYIDCFSLILKAAGFDRNEIHSMYPLITQTILELYSNHIANVPDVLSSGNNRFDSIQH